MKKRVTIQFALFITVVSSASLIHALYISLSDGWTSSDTLNLGSGLLIGILIGLALHLMMNKAMPVLAACQGVGAGSLAFLCVVIIPELNLTQLTIAGSILITLIIMVAIIIKVKEVRDDEKV